MSSLLFLLRNSIYQMLFLIDSLLQRKNPITVFCYHSISSDDWRYGVSLEEFKKQINYLLSQGFTPICTHDLQQYLTGKKEINNHSFIIHFDDGYKDILSVRTFLKSKGIKPTVFLLSNTRKPNRRELDNHYQFLSLEDVQKLKKIGWEIGSHSSTHCYLKDARLKTLKKEILGSKQALERSLGEVISYFAYPRGGYNDLALTLTYSSGYNLSFSMDDGVISRSTEKNRIPRVGVDRTHSFDQFKATFSPSVIALRGFVKKLGVTL